MKRTEAKPMQLAFNFGAANDNVPRSLPANDNKSKAESVDEYELAELRWTEICALARQLEYVADGPRNDVSHFEACRLVESLYELIA